MFSRICPVCLRRMFYVLLLLTAILIMGGCEAITSALPPNPSPFPTLPRLPSVTAIPPTAPATITPPPVIPTATPTLPVGTAAVQANLRSGPGVNFSIVGVVAAGEQVTLRGQNSGWYQVSTPDGTLGWMSSRVLNVEADAATAVPTVTP